MIGNSQMIWDLDKTLEMVAATAPSGGPKLHVTAQITFGTGLAGYWADGKPQAAIASRKWDVVVLQEAYAPDATSFRTSADKFRELVMKNGAQLVLFATGTPLDLYPDGITRLFTMNEAIAKDYGVPVAPAGLTWLTYLGAAPSDSAKKALYHADLQHPGPRGSYLYALSLYATITGRTPVGATYRPAAVAKDAVDLTAVSEAEALQMQQAAWRRYQDTPAAH